MDVLRRQVASLASAPTAVVAIQRDKITALQTGLSCSTSPVSPLGLLAGLAGVALFTSGIARRVGLNAENARRLGEGLPLEPISHAGDEIGRLARLTSHGRRAARQPGRRADQGQG